MQPLKGKQRAALLALLDGATVTDAATAAGVDRVTLWRWLKSADFAAALVEAADLAITTAARRLALASDQAVTVLTELAADEGQPAGVRIRSADLVLSHSTKLVELVDILTRLTVLENRQHEYRN